jgi:FkbM family methyltransferase
MLQKRVLIVDNPFFVSGDPQDRYFREYVTDGGFFADAPITVAQRYCTCDAVMVDVGANIGLVTLAFSHIARKGHVIALEPSPRSFAYLQSNIEANHLSNVVALNVALSDREGVVQFREDPEFMAGSRIKVATDDSSPLADVSTTTLDLEFSRHGFSRLDMLKIDVEGHERQVLEGSIGTLQKYRPMCVVEFNSYTLVYLQRVVPKDFLFFLKSIFPNVYYYDRDRSRLSNVKGRDDEFLKHNTDTGFVDDLVCTFVEVPDGR